MTELLSNLDIVYYCKLLKIPINDVLSKDLFNDIKPKEGNYVINLDDSQNQGTHWTCIILKDNYAVYYDSFGLSMPNDILKFIYRYSKKINLVYSNDQIQHYNSVYCGWFVIYFLYFFNVNKCKNYKHLINKHNSIFKLEDRKLNDKIIRQLFFYVFNKYKIKI